MLCPKCKIEIDNDSYYCDQCGQEIRFCLACKKPGKGNRCTRCGGVMMPASSWAKEQSSPKVEEWMQPPTAPNNTTQPANCNEEATIKVGNKPHLILSNPVLGLAIEAVDGAIIGRRKGIYQRQFSGFPYVSGTHARLNYDTISGRWTITDLESSNGSKYDGKELQPGTAYPLADGGTIQIANIQLNVSVKVKTEK